MPSRPRSLYAAYSQRSRILPARRHGDLARLRQLAAAEPADPARGALRVRLVVAAPGDVHAQTSPAGSRSRACRRTARSSRRDRCGRPALPDPAAHRPVGAAAGCAFPAPVAGEVEQLGRPGRHRQRHPQAVDLVRLRAGVGQHVPHAQQAGRRQLDLGAQRQPGDRVRGGEHDLPRPAASTTGAANSGEKSRPVRDPSSPGRPVRRCRTRAAGRPAPARPGCAAHRRHRAAASSASVAWLRSGPRSAPQCRTVTGPAPRASSTRLLPAAAGAACRPPPPPSSLVRAQRQTADELLLEHEVDHQGRDAR